MATNLELALLYLFAAVLGVVGCRLLKLPAMLGYLLVGVVIGPNALALARDSAGVRYLAEFGVVFLMFVIGLEFNLPKLRSMHKLVFGLGMGQVVLTVLGAVVGNVMLAWLFSLLGRAWELSWQGSVALGSAMAMSSTAIVAKMMAERLEIESEHGRRVMGVLLFQDLAVVPLLVLIPSLAQGGDDLWRTLGSALAKAAVLLTLLLWGGQKLMRWWLTLVAKRKSEELFVLNLLLVTLGLAWLTEHAGLSLALGAFVAGMLIAETEYKHQVETDIRPFHDVLLGLFFITIGMKLDWRPVLDQWALVLALSVLPVLTKAVTVAALARWFGATPGVAIRTGLYLAQAGEFGFVLLTLGAEQHLIANQWMSPVLAAMVLSMLATPFIILHSDRVVMRLSATDWLMQSVQLTSIARRSIRTEAHVIICGYGRSGQNLARLLEHEHIPYMALDLDPDRVRQAAAAGQSVVFGDAARLQSLMAAGLARASAVVVSYHDTQSALKVLHHVRDHAPQVPVVVRTIDDVDLEKLRAAGATEVVPEAIEGSLMLASHALALVGVPVRRVIRLIQDARDARYGLLRGYFHGADDDLGGGGDQQQARLHTVSLPLASPTVGVALGELALHAVGVSVVNVRRLSGQVLEASDELALQGGDVLVISGAPEALALAEGKLLRG
ncbi:Kef-type potassium/proton antiporter (CPA2 family) [Sphaerotilus hippei]|uniref:Kef-type potassium/proton antiporter (CPA2 family) n=1 Tax=Sphaerotilus hippei TaxID=744406 RepID=A0A318H663_9BURK|nr:cation:proton antiporter [Sphaerotilus hippei]PXW99474.1 Kef-type potassium/proton antiporter (CPA2 family) [Sphaerotilus hippei]